MTIAEATNLQNTLHWPVVLAATCVAGQFSVPINDCIGEYLVRMNAGGAIAVLAPTGLPWDSEASQLDDRLAQLLHANTLPALGDNVRQAMADHVRLDDPNMPVWIYNLLGHPALRFNVVRDLWMGEFVQANGSLLLYWSGGKPPYQLEMTSGLQTGTLWAPVGSPTTATNLVVPVNSPATFFRVKSSL